ncbi:hypothetical protein MRX96_019822 [Rhipicephalus microplus]
MNTALSVGEFSEADVSAHEEGVIQYAFSDDMLERIRSEQANSRECASLLEACMQGWLAKHYTPQLLKQFWVHNGNITVCKQLLLKDSRLVIPRALRKEMLRRVHEGHQGIARCRASAKESLWWPEFSKDIAQAVANCQACATEHTQFSEPMIQSETTELPWQKIGIDLFEMKGAVYLAVVDYHSRYPGLALLDRGTSSKAVIQHLTSYFARHGIPQTVISDNGPQFISFTFADFARNYRFRRVTSPRYPQANGEADRMTGTLKRLLKKAEDPYITLLNYRKTLGPTGFSPPQLLMSRRLRSKVPCMPSALKPEVALKYGSKTEVPRARPFVLLKHRDTTRSKLKERPYAETGVISSFSHTEEKQAPVISHWDLVCGRRWLKELSAIVATLAVVVCVSSDVLSDHSRRRPVILIAAGILISASVGMAFVETLPCNITAKFLATGSSYALTLTMFVLPFEPVGKEQHVL